MNQGPNFEIPEISFSLHKFKLFESEIFAFINSDWLPAFNKFIEKLNQNLDFDICKSDLIQELVSKRNPNFKLLSIKDHNFIRNYLGTEFTNMIEKIEEQYRIIGRENKINQITND